MANSALETIIKNICNDSKIKSCDKKDTLYKLSSHLLKEFKYFPDDKLNSHIRDIGSGLLKITQAIESIRSDNTEAHGKDLNDYLISDQLYSQLIINSVSTVGLFLLNFYERKYKKTSDPD